MWVRKYHRAIVLIKTALLFAFFLVSISIFGEESEFSTIFAEYKKGNYESVARHSESHITSSLTEKDPRIFFLYVSTESNWTRLKKNIPTSPPPNFQKSVQFWNAIFLFLERALVFGENDLIVRLGKDFQKFANQSPKYSEGLYIYATSLMELKNIDETKKVLNQLEELKLTPNQKHLISELKSNLK